MYDSRIDWRRPGRDLLDPELENIVASRLIEATPRHYALAVFQVGTACIIAGALILLLAVYGSTAWHTSILPEQVPTLLRMAMLGIVVSIIGALTALVSAARLKFGRGKQAGA